MTKLGEIRGVFVTFPPRWSCDEYILRFDITMTDAVIVEVFHRLENLFRGEH